MTKALTIKIDDEDYAEIEKISQEISEYHGRPVGKGAVIRIAIKQFIENWNDGKE